MSTDKWASQPEWTPGQLFITYSSVTSFRGLPEANWCLYENKKEVIKKVSIPTRGGSKSQAIKKVSEQKVGDENLWKQKGRGQKIGEQLPQILHSPNDQ